MNTRSKTIFIPELGEIKYRIIAVGFVETAFEEAHKATEADKPFTFANRLISAMVEDPILTPDEVDKLPAEAIDALVAVAAEMGVKTEFENTPNTVSARERLYYAYKDWSKNLIDKVAYTIDKLPKFASTVNNALAGLTNDFYQVVSATVTPTIESITSQFEQQLAGIAKSLEQLITQAKTASITTGPYLKKAGFWIPPSAPFMLLQSLEQSILGGRNSPKDIRDMIVSFYREDDFEALRDMVLEWNKSGPFAPRMSIINQALTAHTNGLYAVSIPALLPQFEGILRDIIGSNSSGEVILKRLENEAESRYYNSLLSEAYSDALITYVIGESFYKTVISLNVQDFVNWLTTHGLSGDQVLHRHAILHGAHLTYASEENSLRAFFLLDALSRLHHDLKGRKIMTEKYNPQEIEPKWQRKWEETGLYRQKIDRSKPKHYALTMLPYPSGDMHIGHWYAMTPSDARARWMRMKGYNVLFPMGFDAFGLPAENAAIARNIHPAKWTYANIERMRKQLKSMGAMFDWEREAVSADPKYYKWTQWFFKKLMEQGLAYRKMSAVDFCPKCNTTLAREQVWGEDRHCERCGTPVIKKDLEQWFFKTTSYAEELLDFSQIDWPERVRVMQTNWIGRSIGAEVIFHTEQEDPIPIFTTRPDTLWGATFMVMAPEHPLVEKLTTAEQKTAVAEYQFQAKRMSDIDRETADREKTGVFTGSYAINPVNGEHIPIWVADYVLMGYGSGAIMAVPAHDERDFEFATKYNLPIVEVIRLPEQADAGGQLTAAYTSKTEGVMVNSGPFDGTPVDGAVERVTNWLEEQGIGKKAINYRLRDWLISRQRYWGAPIPVVYCPEHGAVAVPDDQLPVMLPEDVEFMPTGESPLKFHQGFLHTTCPTCGKPALRETDTMDTFMCSSWYQYRYLSPDYDEGPFDPEEGAYWLPVDQYTGGVEHATMHLIYTRFFSKAMRDMGLVNDDEPMTALYNQGMVLGEDGEKMSKSRGNVIAPDDLVQKYGADAVRTYLMFFAKWDQGGPWNYDGIKGPQRLLNDVWEIAQHTYAPKVVDESANKTLRRKTHQTIRKVTQDLESFSFNTAVAAIMEFRNSISEAQKARNVATAVWDEAITHLLFILCPIAPHITEELWARRGQPYSIHQQAWPQWDAEAAKEDTITLVVQVNGKVRDKMEVSADAGDEVLQQTALASDKIQPWLEGKQPKKVLVVRGKLVNIVV